LPQEGEVGLAPSTCNVWREVLVTGADQQDRPTTHNQKGASLYKFLAVAAVARICRTIWRWPRTSPSKYSPSHIPKP